MKNSNKGLNHDEPILFEIGGVDKSGVDLNKPTFKENFIGECFEDREIGLPGLSEPESIRPVSYTHLTLPTNREV